MKRTALSLFLLLTGLHAFAATMYVSSAPGASIYAGPSTKSAVIGHLWYGQQVWTIEDSTIKDNKLNNTKLKSKWAVVAVEMADRDGSEQYYVLKEALHPDNDTDQYHIPPSSLFYFYGMNIGSPKGYFSISYYEKTSPWEREQSGDTTPYDYNAPNTADPIIDDNGKRTEYFQPGVLDTLRSYISMELVDINAYQHKKKKNKYRIDTSHVAKELSGYPQVYKFSLPINNGKDKIIIASDSFGEAQFSRYYAGQIPYLNKYIIGHAWEDEDHYLIDKKTGKIDTAFTTGGLPYFSPDGKYIIDFYNPYIFQDDNHTILTISHLDNKMHITNTISINSKSWVADTEANSAFWITNREIILKVYAVKNLMDDKEYTKKEKYHYQYIKLRIL